jgi:hypothetical protein
MDEAELDRIVGLIAEAFGVSNPTTEQREAVRKELESQPCAEDVV